MEHNPYLTNGRHRRVKQPLGRTEELQEKAARQAEERRADEVVYYGSAYGTRHPSDTPPAAPKKTKKNPRHRFAWFLLALFCLCGLGLVGLFAAPQLMNIQYQTLPNYAFAGGQLIQLDTEALRSHQAMVRTLQTDALFPGITVDGVDVGGMTLSQAKAAVEQVDAAGGGDFAITVDISGSGWLIDSTQVPLTRNVDEVLSAAWSYGRGNTTDIRGGSVTPVQQRAQTVAALPQQGIALTTHWSYDRSLIRSLTDQIAEHFNIPAVNASVAAFDLNTKSFTFNEDTPGLYLDGDALYQAVMDTLDSDPFGTVHMEPELVIASMTKAELMNLLHKVSSYTTSTTSNSNRNTNIRLSAEAINGVVVQPGETFSFNRTTGERTAAKGYKEATAISGGQTKPEVGGGVCQTSSTLFNAVARANLEIVTRSPHAWPSSYVEKGMDATVNWPGLDFQFKNNTDWPIYIVAWYDNRKVTVELYGMTLGDGITIDLESKVVETIEAPKGVKEVQNPDLPHGTRKTTVTARKGYVVETWQLWKRGGEVYDRVLLCTSTYKAYQQTVEYN